MTLDVNYKYCPLCGGQLTLKRLKETEPERLICTICDFVFYLDPKVATGAIIEMAGGIVLVKRGIVPAYGKWVVPGGYVDRYETPAQATVRETWEEARLKVRIENLVGLYSYSESYVIVAMYRATHVGGTLTAADESLDAAVFPRDDIPWEDLAFPSTRDGLRDYFKQNSRR